MTERKRPEGDLFTEFVRKWYEADHTGKVNLAQMFEVSYETAKHWISEQGVARKPEKPALVFPPVPESRPNVPTKLTTKEGLATAAILGDTHCPYQDNEVVAAVEKFLEDSQPDYIVYNGDINDFYQVSSFSKDPSRLAHLQDDIDITTAMFKRHREIVPDAEIIFIEGTHENRWYKYLQDKAPAVSQLRGTTIPALYDLEKLGITYVPFERGVLVNGTFLILHGDYASIHSSYTAKHHFEQSGGSGICNHTHRGGSYYKRDRFGVYGWWENFCLCRLDPDWIQNPNWQQGFSMVTFSDTGRFFVEQVPIIDGQFIYGGKVY